MWVIHSAIINKLLKPRAIILVNFDEIPFPPSNTEKLMVFCDMDQIPGLLLKCLIGIANVCVEGVVDPIVFVHIGISILDYESDVDVIVGETDIRIDFNFLWKLMG